MSHAPPPLAARASPFRGRTPCERGHAAVGGPRRSEAEGARRARRAMLRRVLPLEGHLQQMLGVRGKCITETENVVKAVMRTVDRETLVRLGVVGVDTRL